VCRALNNIAILVSLWAAVVSGSLAAEPAVAHVIARPDRSDCRYASGETAHVSFTLVAENGEMLTRGRLKVAVDNFGSRALVPDRTVDLSVENPVRVVVRRDSPGFARVTLSTVTTNDFLIDGNYSWGRNLPAFTYGIGYDVGRISPGTPDVPDFDAFWSNAVARLDATVPVDARVEPQTSPDPSFTSCRISVATAQGRRVWGWLTEPKDLTKGPYPVHIEVSGAGIGWSEPHPGMEGAVVCRMNVHSYPQAEGSGDGPGAERLRLYRLQDEKYAKPHGVETYYYAGIHRSREDYFYYAVILGLNRVVDWLATRPECDARRFTYGGTSQGGGMGLALTYLNRHIARSTIAVPAITDLLGSEAEADRLSGWPQLVENQLPENRASARRNAPYFCGVNFARRIRKPIRFAVGFADLTCPPNAGCAAYNVCPSADKGLLCGIAMGHRLHPVCYTWLDGWERDPATAPKVPETVWPDEGCGRRLADMCWMWGHETGQVDGAGNAWGLDVGTNAVEMTAGALSFGLRNLNVVRWDKPGRGFRESLAGMRRVTWPITGYPKAGVKCDYDSHADWCFEAAREMPNVTGFELDDFFNPDKDKSKEILVDTPTGPRRICRTAFPYSQLRELRKRMDAFGRPLDLRMVVYDELFDKCAADTDLLPALELADTVTYWTWCAKNIGRFPENFARLRRLVPGKRVLIGVYLWDFGDKREMPREQLERLLTFGLDLWRKGEADGFVFLCSSLCSRPLPAVEGAREWLVRHADERRPEKPKEMK